MDGWWSVNGDEVTDNRMAVRTVLMVPKHPLTSVVEPRRRSADTVSLTNRKES